MNNLITPAVWLIVLIAGLPQFSETVYSPSLPDIAQSLSTSVSAVEYTLTIYLFGFAIGTIFWGNISDRYGRKPCMIIGFIIFALACIGCYCSNNIEFLLLSRFIQAFGGSVGSVLGQTVARDAFIGPRLGQVFASVASALAIFPAIGPIIGALIAGYFGWRSIFLLLFITTITLIIIITKHLPETLMTNQKQGNILYVAKSLIVNKKALLCCFIVAACNGLMFSYYSEGPFYLIDTLGMKQSHYGLSFIFIAASTFLGGLLSKRLNHYISPYKIIDYAVIAILINEIIFVSLVFNYLYFIKFSINLMIKITILAHMIRMFGACMANSNALALGLQDYKSSIGAASSLFGFLYYLLIATFTFGIGKLHNGSLLVMPLYFLAIISIVFIIYRSNTDYSQRT